MSWRADDDVLETRERTGAPGSESCFPSTKTMLVSRMERPASRERCCYLASHDALCLLESWRAADGGQHGAIAMTSEEANE